MRRRYPARHDQLMATLAERAPRPRGAGIAAGPHAVVELSAGAGEPAPRAVRRCGIVLNGLG